MINQDIQNFSNQLKELEIRHEIVEHEQFSDYKDFLFGISATLADCCPILIMVADNNKVAIIKRGDCKLDFSKIKNLLGVKDLRLATKQEFTELTHLPVGAARILIPGIKFLLDRKLFEKEYLYGGAGSFTVSFKYKSKDFKKIPDSVVCDITE